MPAVKRYSRRKSRRPTKRMRTGPYSAKVRANMRRKNNFARSVKKIILKQSETKHKVLPLDYGRGVNDPTFSNVAERHNVDHNSIQAFRLWETGTTSVTGLWPSQGDTDSNREGDRIMCTGFMLRGEVNFNANAQGAMVKLFYLPYESSQGNPLSINDIFHNPTSYGGGANGLWQVAPIQNKRWPGLQYLTTIKMPMGLNVGNDNYPVRFRKWVPIKRSINFLHDGTTAPANLPTNGYILAVGDGKANLTAAYAVGAIRMGAALYWKDV